MKQIKHLVGYIHGELEYAERYAKCAVEHKTDDPELAMTYFRIANQELEHADLLHAQAVRLINAYDGEPPAGMQAVWDWEHEKDIDTTARVKTLLSMYRT